MNDMTPTAPKYRKVVLSLTQRIGIYNKLQEVCTRTSENKARYAVGWSDAKVAAVVGAPVKENHVAYVREEMFGDLERKSTNADAADLDARITQIEDYLTRQNPNWKTLL